MTRGEERMLALWREYRESGDLTARNRLVLTLAPVVKQVVFRRVRGLPSHCELDDFLSCGIEALIRAIDRYDPDRGVSLEQYVWARIHGAVLDEARRQDWAPRSLRAFQRERDTIVREFSAVHRRPPRREEVAIALALEPAELRLLEQRAALADVHSLNVPVGGLEDDEEPVELLDTLPARDRATLPEEAVIARTADGPVAAALAGLSPRDREVAELLYVEDMTLREIGARLGVTESRVSQLHARIKKTVERAVERPVPAA